MAETPPPAEPRPPARHPSGVPTSGPPRTDADEQQKRLASAAAGAGFQFALAVVLFVYAGQWLDRKFGTSPLMLLLGLFLGAGGAFFSMYRRLMAAQADPTDPPRRP